MKLTEQELEKIHSLSINNGDAVLKSDYCGCFSTGKIFPAGEIKSCIHELTAVEQITVLSPYSGIDSVIPSYSLHAIGWDLTQELIDDLKKRYFY